MLKSSKNRAYWWVVAAILALVASKLHAVQVQDVVRLKGSERSKLVGMGLVFGLNGTGDGGKFLPAMRPLAKVVGHLVDENVVAGELKDAKNVALVALTAEIPAGGVREGDRIDVHVSTIGPAKSLRGGRLFMIPMKGPLKESPVYAFAEGPITLEDAETPTVGRVVEGAQLTRNVMAQYLDNYGRIHLIINQDNASWPVANNLASVINGLIAPDGPNIAKAIDQKNVLVAVPTYDREDPASFISQILQTYIDPAQVASGAKVVINERTKTIIVTGDVQISPAAISHAGLTISTVTPAPQPTQFDPQVEEQPFIAMDPMKRGGTKLADLLAVFNQLKVPAEDRIAIIKNLKRSGKLHAELIVD